MMRVYYSRALIARSDSYGLGQEAKDLAFRCLVDSLSDPDPFCRAGAAYGLAGCGDRANEAVPALQSHQGDADEIVRDAVDHALGEIQVMKSRTEKSW